MIRSVLIINLEVKDNHEEAATGAKLALDLCQDVSIFAQVYISNDLCMLMLNATKDVRMFVSFCVGYTPFEV